LGKYVDRYADVAGRAGLAAELESQTGLVVVERYVGVGSTDFWGISFASSSLDTEPLTYEALERRLKLLRACWSAFDDIAARVSPMLAKGVRGGGRDRDQIVRHTRVTEQGWAPKIGVKTTPEAMFMAEGLEQHRDDYCDAIRRYHREAKPARTWSLSFLLRHTAYHVMDHAWEMEDKDLSRT
jgi:hypothetical protein